MQEIEKFKIESGIYRYGPGCEACHKKFKILFTIIIGDTKLIKVCTRCKGKLKRALSVKIK